DGLGGGPGGERVSGPPDGARSARGTRLTRPLRVRCAPDPDWSPGVTAGRAVPAPDGSDAGGTARLGRAAGAGVGAGAGVRVGVGPGVRVGVGSWPAAGRSGAGGASASAAGWAAGAGGAAAGVGGGAGGWPGWRRWPG